jgi:cytochrome P450
LALFKIPPISSTYCSVVRRPRIQQIVDEIISRVEPQGHMDLIADFAFRLPVTVICDMLGIPEEVGEVFFTGSRIGGRLLDLAPLSRAEIDEQNYQNLAMAIISMAYSNCAGASPVMTSPRTWFRPRKTATLSPTKN